MFVMSLRASTLKVTAALAALAVVVAAACWEGGAVHSMDLPAQGGASAQARSSAQAGTSSQSAVSSQSGVSAAPQSVDVSTNSGRIAFLKSFGWEVSSDPVEVVEVVIPQKFNAVYTNYNAIQKSQGYDLLRFRGKRVKRWTYDIKNFPGTQAVRANLLIYNNKVIGGDVSSVALDGFMQGFGQKTVDTKNKTEPSQADIVAETFAAGGKT